MLWPLFALAIVSPLSGQLISVTGGPGFPAVRIDVTSGAVQTLVPTGATSAYGGLSAFDPAGHRLFFLTGAIGTQQLVTVNVATGSVTSVPIPSPSSYVFFEFDQTTGRVLAVTNAPGFPLLSIDPATGVVQPLVLTNTSPWLSAIDNATRRLFLGTGSTGTQTLVTVDLTTFAITSVPIPRPDDHTLFEYDPVTARIIAVTNGPGVPVLSINPSTGSITSLVSTGASSPLSGLGAFDPASRRFFFLTGSQTLFTVNVDLLTVTTTSIPSADPFIFFEGDFVGLQAIPTLSNAMMLLLAILLAMLAWRVTAL